MRKPRFAQHAFLGEHLHLETTYVSESEWHWQVLRKGREVRSGTEGTLEAAKSAAREAAGVTGEVEWEDIGPSIESG